MSIRKTIIRLTAIVLFIYICAMTEEAAGQIGGQAGAFLRLGLGADRVAMGDCGVALNGGSNDWYYNAAALPTLESYQASFGYRSMSLDRKIMYAGFSMPLEQNAGLAFGVMRAGTDNIDIRDSAGNHIYMMDHSDNVIYGSFALQPHPMVAAGISIKWMINAVPDILDDDKNLYAYSLSVDLGLQVIALPQLKFGLQVKDLGGSYSWNTSDLWKDDHGAKEDNLPNLLRIGAAWDPLEDLTVATDLMIDADRMNEDSGGIEEVHIGGEYRLELNETSGLRLRSGWNCDVPFELYEKYGFKLRSWKGDVLTFGFGLEMDLTWAQARMDYAFYNEDIAPGSAHLICWVFEF